MFSVFSEVASGSELIPSCVPRFQPMIHEHSAATRG